MRIMAARHPLFMYVLYATSLIRGYTQPGILTEYILRQENFNDRLMSRFLLYTTTAANKMTCAIQCMEDIRCVCFIFNKAERGCRLLGISYSDPSAGVLASGTRLFYLSRAIGYIGYPCTSNADCKAPLSACNAGVCDCGIEYSYSVNGGCVRYCASYGTDFTAYIEKGLIDNNMFRDWDYSQEACLDLCLSQTAYQCLTVERYPYDGFCTLTDVTWFDVALVDRDMAAYGYVMYHRNCAV